MEPVTKPATQTPLPDVANFKVPPAQQTTAVDRFKDNPKAREISNRNKESKWDVALATERIKSITIKTTVPPADVKSEYFINIQDPVSGRTPSFITPALLAADSHLSGLGVISSSEANPTPLSRRFYVLLTPNLTPQFAADNPKTPGHAKQFFVQLEIQAKRILENMFDSKVKPIIINRCLDMAIQEWCGTDENRAAFLEQKAQMKDFDYLSIPGVREMALKHYYKESNVFFNPKKAKPKAGEKVEQHTPNLSFLKKEPVKEVPVESSGKTEVAVFFSLPTWRLPKGLRKAELLRRYSSFLKPGQINVSEQEEYDIMTKCGAIYNGVSPYLYPSTETIQTQLREKLTRDYINKTAKLKSAQQPIPPKLKEDYDRELQALNSPFTNYINSGSTIVIRGYPEAYSQAGDTTHFGVRYRFELGIQLLRQGNKSYSLPPITDDDDFVGCDTWEMFYSEEGLKTDEQELKIIQQIENDKIPAPTVAAVNQEDNNHKQEISNTEEEEENKLQQKRLQEEIAKANATHNSNGKRKNQEIQSLPPSKGKDKNQKRYVKKSRAEDEVRAEETQESEDAEDIEFDGAEEEPERKRLKRTSEAQSKKAVKKIKILQKTPRNAIIPSQQDDEDTQE